MRMAVPCDGEDPYRAIRGARRETLPVVIHLNIMDCILMPRLDRLAGRRHLRTPLPLPIPLCLFRTLSFPLPCCSSRVSDLTQTSRVKWLRDS